MRICKVNAWDVTCLNSTANRRILAPALLHTCARPDRLMTETASSAEDLSAPAIG